MAETAGLGLELIDVHHAYGRQASLRGVSLRVEPGDRYGFLGHNGAGKTTAMRIALGLSRPRRGRVRVDGFDAARYPREARARMGGMIEVTGFYPAASGRRNLIELARLQGFTRHDAEGEADRLLDQVGLTASGLRAVGGYSQGMRQRLGLAQAMLGRPRYLLLDEPMNGLDPEGIAVLRAVLERLAGEGMTVLLSSHLLHEVATLCNRIGVLQQGRMLLEATTDELLRPTRDRFEVVVDDPAGAAAVLDRLGLEHRPLVPRGSLVTLAGTPPASLVRALVAGGVGIEKLAPRPETLEEVYLRVAERGEVAAPAATGDAAAPAARMAPPREALAPKRGLWRLVRHELRRACRPGVVILSSVPALAAVWRIGALAIDDAANQAQVASGKLFSFAGVTAFEATARGLAAALPAAIVLTAARASQSIAGDLSLGTLRNVLLRPLTRVEVALGKAAAILARAATMLVAATAAALAAAAACFDFGDRLEVAQGGGMSALVIGRSDVLPHLPLALASPLLPLFAYAGLGFLCGALVSRAAGALGLALGATVVLDLGRAVARPLGGERWLPSAYLPSPFGDTSRLATFADLSIGSADAFFRFESTALAVPLAWMALAFGLATLILLRRHVP